MIDKLFYDNEELLKELGLIALFNTISPPLEISPCSMPKLFQELCVPQEHGLLITFFEKDFQADNDRILLLVSKSFFSSFFNFERVKLLTKFTLKGIIPLKTFIQKDFEHCYFLLLKKEKETKKDMQIPFLKYDGMSSQRLFLKYESFYSPIKTFIDLVRNNNLSYPLPPKTDPVGLITFDVKEVALFVSRVPIINEKHASTIRLEKPCSIEEQVEYCRKSNLLIKDIADKSYGLVDKNLIRIDENKKHFALAILEKVIYGNMAANELFKY